MSRKNKYSSTGIFIFSFVVLNTLLVQAQESNSLLWKIEKKGIKDSYLFGTFHILPQSDFELKEKVLKSLGDSDQLVLEMNMADPNFQSEIFKGITMRNGKSLDMLLTRNDYSKLDSMLKVTVGAGIVQFKTFKPFFISSLLMSKYVGEEPASFEKSLMQYASDNSWKVEGLETPAEQLAIFDEISYESQIEGLMDMVYKEDEMDSLFNEMIAMYKAEKVEPLFKMTNEYFDDEEESNILLANRNKRWLPLFSKLARKKSTFFAVGAGHLGGETGLINLLIQEGFKLTPIF